MAVTDTPRFALTQWSAGSDAPVTRAQLNGDNATVDALAAGWLQDVAANRPAASAANVGFLFRASDTGVISLSTGSAWITIPVGTFLALAGGTMTGPLDLGSQELRAAVVTNAKDKRFTGNATGGLVIDADNGPSQTLTLTGNVSSITVNNLSDGESLRITLLQDGTGSRTVAFPGTWLWVGGSTARPALASAANARNTLFLDMIGSAVEAFLVADQKT